MAVDDADPSRRRFLRAGLMGGAAAALGLGVLWQRQLAGQRLTIDEALGPLAPAIDESTGLPLLLLPPGFRYRTLSWASTPLHDGFPTPRSADGMGVVAQHGSRITLVRNHELRGSSGPIGNPASAYDVGGGGTTTLVFDTGSESIVDSWISLGGTLNNCAGGITPWETWLSCEECPFSPTLTHLRPPSKQAAWHIEGAREEHGFVFEVPADGVAEPEPIKAMGQFYHEAAAVDPDTGTVYMTEDASPKAGFYRYLPNQPGRLAAGGRLQMLAVERRRDLRDDLVVGEWMTTNWVDIDDPTRGFSPNSREGDGVVSQGIEAGGSWFDALEGCVFSAGRIWFTSKTGGNARSGYVFEYDPGAEAVRLIYESPGHGELSGPDNLVMSPRGSLVVCEDKTTWFKTGQRLAGLNADGRLTHFSGINPELDAAHLGFDLRDTARKSEWAGACYSPDGQWMFVNIYNPGCTVAITGPWQPGSV